MKRIIAIALVATIVLGGAVFSLAETRGTLPIIDGTIIVAEHTQEEIVRIVDAM